MATGICMPSPRARPSASSRRARCGTCCGRRVSTSVRKSVPFGGCSFDHGEALFAPLHRVMLDHNVTADVFVDIGPMDTSLGRWARVERRNMRERLRLLRGAREQSPSDYAEAVIAFATRLATQ